LDIKEWTERDDTFDFQLAEKRRLYAAVPDQVFVEEPDSREAQSEVLELLQRHLGCNPEPSVSAPLITASLLVQEDLVLMRRSAQGWRLIAGSVCFPSSWTLTEKFGRSLDEIHGPVPGFNAGTRNADLITRMFDKLQVDQPVMRYNWSIQAGDALYHPFSHSARNESAEPAGPRFPEDPASSAFVRVERQTLRKLPRSGDILFTIRIYLDPIGWLADHPERATVAKVFADQLMALDQEQLDYKGFTDDRDRLVMTLHRIARDG
jgi:hypothetical protein